MRSDRLYDARYRPRNRSNPVGAFVGLLVVTLITGVVLIGGGAYLGGTLVAVTASSASPGPTADPHIAAAPGRTAHPDATRRPDPGSTTTPTGPLTGAVPGDPGTQPFPSRRPGGDAAATAEPSPGATPTRTPHPWADLKPKPRRGPFQMDIYRDGAMASEATPQWCVPAAMLTMINIVKKRRPDTSYDEQKRLYYLARRHSTDKLTGAGAEPEGWAEGLNREGVGPYIVYVAPSRRLAIRQAAKALRLTGRPVGLLAWRGAHSMVLTGFKSTGDPAWTNDYDVTDVIIADVWWPRISSIWGQSLPPGSMEPVERLAEDFLAWRRPDVKYPKKDGQFVVILPVRRDGRFDPGQGD